VYYYYPLLLKEFNSLKTDKVDNVSIRPVKNRCEIFKNLSWPDLSLYNSVGFFIVSCVYFLVIVINIYFCVINDSNDDEKDYPGKELAITIVFFTIGLIVIVMNLEVGFEMVLSGIAREKTRVYTNREMARTKQRFIDKYVWFTDKQGFDNKCIVSMKKVAEKIFEDDFKKNFKGMNRGIFEREAVSDCKWWTNLFWWGTYCLFLCVVFEVLLIVGESDF